jgi:anti-sigma factor RsiW
MELLSAYADGECTPDETAEIRAHLEECGDCRTRLAGIKTARGVMRGLPKRAPNPKHLVRLRSALERESEKEERRRPIYIAVAVSAAAAVLIVAVILIFTKHSAPAELPVVKLPNAGESESAPEITPEPKIVVKPETPSGKQVKDESAPGKVSPAPEEKIAEQPVVPAPSEPKTADSNADVPVAPIPGVKPDGTTAQDGRMGTEAEERALAEKKALAEKAAVTISEFETAREKGDSAGQIAAVRTIAKVKSPASVAFLEQVVEKGGMGLNANALKREAVAALGEIGTKDGARVLLSVYNYPSCEIAFAVPPALQKISDNDGVEYMIQRFDESKEFSERRLLAETLGRTGNRAALEPMLAAAAKEKDIYVRAAAIESLGRLGVEPDVLVKMYAELKGNSTRWYLRQAVVRALGLLSDDSTVDTLIKALAKDPHSLVREEAARSLGRLGHPDAIPMIKRALKSAEPASRFYGELVRAGVTISEDPMFGKPAGIKLQTAEQNLSVYSNNVLFLIDVSSSMNHRGKMEWIRRELERVLGALRPNQQYNIMVFSSSVKQIYQWPLYATPDEVAKTVKDLPKILTTQKEISDWQPVLSKALGTAADTIIVFSDGSCKIKPGKSNMNTTGENGLPTVKEFTEKNRLEQARIYTVALLTHSEPSPDEHATPCGEDVEFMRALASENGGAFLYQWFNKE